MRLGISSHTFWHAVAQGRMDARGLVDLAAEWQVPVVQLCDNLPVEKWTDGEVACLRDYAAGKPVALDVGTRGSQPEHLRRMITIARGFGSPILRLAIDSPGDLPSTEQVVTRLRPLQRDLRLAGVTLAIENQDRFASDALAWIVGELEHDHVAVSLDTGSSLAIPEGTRQVVETLSPWTSNVVMRDYVVARPGHRQGLVVEGRPAGEGSVDVGWVLSQVRRYGRDVDVVAEGWTTPEATIDQTLQREREWAKRSVENLRKRMW